MSRCRIPPLDEDRVMKMEPITTAKQWIDTLRLQPHPEGGYYRQTYRADEVLSPASLHAGFGGERAMSTAIYYLLEGGDLSVWHRIRQDEVLHFYDGAAFIIHLIDPAGNYSTCKLGRNLAQGELPQIMVPGGHWFAMKVAEGGAYTLLGCTVAPGFDFADLEMPSRADLIRKFPQHRGMIESLTRP
jgi:predicted cupin superfamily sugar epimerase